MTTAVDKWPAAARLVAVAAAGHSDPLLLHHLKGHDQILHQLLRLTYRKVPLIITFLAA